MRFSLFSFLKDVEKLKGWILMHSTVYVFLFCHRLQSRITVIYIHTDQCQCLWVVEYIGSQTCTGRSGGSCPSPDLLNHMSGLWLLVGHLLLPPTPQQTAHSASVTSRRRWWGFNDYYTCICVLLWWKLHPTVLYGIHTDI